MALTPASAAVPRARPAAPRARAVALPTLLAALVGMFAVLSFFDPAARAQAPPRAHTRAAAMRPTVLGALQALQRSNSLTPAQYAAYTSAYQRAQSALRKLTGTRRTELGSVLENVRQIAAAREFTPSRLPALFLTLERNVQWWTTEPLPTAEERMSFPPSRLVWEYYPGQGLEIQWLATFGEANGYYLQGHENAQLQELLNEAIPLATQRAGGIAWEYMFRFDGGAPPWTSGLSQGTALQALSRAYSRLKNPAYLAAAKQALGIFQTPPPAGVLVRTRAGAHYLEYTYAPSERILNGFIQADIGLYDYAKLTADPLGEQLFEAGDAEARAEVPHYDTGAWSLYDQHSESNLNYHELLTEFLQNLCKRTQEGPPIPPAAPRVAATAAPKAAPIPGDEIYCTTAESFTEDLHTPPAIALLTHRLRGGARGGVQLSLSKIATVSLSVTRAGHLIWSNNALVERGKPRLLWITPAKAGTYQVTLRAVDLAGNSSTASGTIAVSAPRHG